MPASKNITKFKGTILDVFAHRFVVQTAERKILADMGKHNLEKIPIKLGDEVELMGEQKLSEIKIQKMVLNGNPVNVVATDHEHNPKHDYDKSQYATSADPDLAIQAAKHENITVIGKPHRKPQHFEVLGKTPQGELVELHVELDGKLSKTKPVKPNDGKWAKELSSA